MTELAELATTEAAEAFAAYGHLGEFEALFLRIEATGLPLGINGRLRCLVVLSRLLPLGVKPEATHLASYLIPVLATSAHERQIIRRAILEWGDATGLSEADAKRGDTAAPRAAGELARGDRRSALLSRLLIGAAILGVAAILIFNLVTGKSPTATHAATSVVTYSQPILTLDLGLDPFWKVLIEDVMSRLGFALVLLLAGFSFITWRDEVQGRLVRQTDQTDLIERFQLKAPLPDWFRSADARAAFDRLKRVRLFHTNRIDVPQTIAVSTRAGGLPLIALRRQRELPNYVLLIDRAALDDMIGVFARTVEAALLEARIVYSRYDFNGGLDRLNPVRGGAQRDLVDEEYLPFSVIATRHAGERLILISTGTNLFETPGFRYDRVLRRRTLMRPGTPVAHAIHLREFSATFLITPAPVSSWGDHESRLRSLGLQIFSADVEGFESLAARLFSAPDDDTDTEPASLTDEDKFLELLDRDTMRLGAAAPPPRAEIDRLVLNLRIWSHDADTYALLGAIAAFPKIDTGFTFVLARMLFGREMDSALFARLVRLPWMRNGYMPDWLRIAIVNALDPDQLARVQAVLLAMLKGTEQKLAGQDGKKTPWHDQLVANFEVARELPHGQLQNLISRIPLQDMFSADERIFFSVLRGHKLHPELEVITPEAPEVVAELFDAPERMRRRRIRLTVIGLAALAALLQPWIVTGLTWGSQSLVTGLRAAGSPFAGLYAYAASAFVAHIVSLVVMMLGLTQWVVNVNRRTPIVFIMIKALTSTSHSPAQLLWDSRIPALYLMLAALSGFMRPGATEVDTSIDAMLLIIGGLMFVWASLVTPERWWNAESADNRLALQVRRDPLTGTLGTLLVVAIWAVPWMLDVLPIINSSFGDAPAVGANSLLLAVCIGVVSWVASNALARRWLLGQAAMFPRQRIWIDAGFAAITVLVIAAVNRMIGHAPDLALESSSNIPSVYLLFFLFWVAPAFLYAFPLRASLGLRRTRPVWGPLINALSAGLAIAILSTMAVAWSVKPIRLEWPVLGASMAGGLVFGAVTAFQFRRSDYFGSTAFAVRVKCVLLGAALFAFAMMSGYAMAELLPGQPLRSIARTFSVSIRDGFEILTWFILPGSLAVWPMFRMLTPTFRIEEPVPVWRRIADSPWWMTLAMWVCGIVWHTGEISFSIWPLAFVVTALVWRRHQERAFVPFLIGTLPLLLRLSDSNANVYTPGGVWPALAVMLLARLTADIPFRQRVLRREHLSWAEVFLIVLLLAPALDFGLGSTILSDADQPLTRLAVRPWILQISLHVDADWMLTAVCVVLGASRMPIWRFGAALIAAWLLPDMAAFINGDRLPIANFISLQPGEVISLLLVLYGMRTWRTYAASRHGTPEWRGFVDTPNGHAPKIKMQGIVLSCAAAVCVAILADGQAPVLFLFEDHSEIGRFAWTFRPSPSATLALALLTGLVAGDLWGDRVSLAFTVGKSAELSFRTIFAPFIATTLFITIVGSLGVAGISAFRLGKEETEIGGSDLGAIGFALSATISLAFGMIMRISAECRNGETWRATARRLWTHPGQSAADATNRFDASGQQTGRSASGEAAAAAPSPSPDPSTPTDSPPWRPESAATAFESSVAGVATEPAVSGARADSPDDDPLRTRGSRGSTAQPRRRPTKKK